MKQFLWRLLQASIIGGIIWANIEYKVTDNPLVAGLAGIIAAAFVTGILSQIIDGIRYVMVRARPSMPE